MNWIFETYSNVYHAAMMQDAKWNSHAAPAKSSGLTKVSTLGRLFRRQ
jgi:hypothetical protein